MERQLQNIGQLNNQNQRWQNIESQLENQNIRMNNTEQQIAHMNSWRDSFTKTQNDVDTLSGEVSSLQSQMRDYDYSIQSYSNLCDTVVTADAARQSSVDYLMDKMISIEIQQDDLQKEQDKLQKQQNQAAEKIVDLQWRSMRENLIFSGINEPKLPRGMCENVEMSLRTFLREEMNIERDIPFDRVHRLGKYDSEQKYPRPIVAKFEKFRDKEFIRKSAPATLRRKTFGVNE